MAKNVKCCLADQAPTPDERQRRKLQAQADKPRSQKILALLAEHGQLSARELAVHLDTHPEVVAKWLRPLKDLGLVEQINERAGGVRKAWYRLAEADSSSFGVE